MELDHIFVFSTNLDTAATVATSLGLTETYRRTHPGQGTSNICYAFDNAFLEFLVLQNASEADSPAIKRMALSQRAAWAHLGTCPLGIAWRPGLDDAAPTFPTWPFRPPYLPHGVHIPVATESDDPHVPLLFQSPGTMAPLDWPAEKRGALQEPAGLRRIIKATLTCPIDFVAGPALAKVLAATNMTLTPQYRRGWGLVLSVARADGTVALLDVLTNPS